MTALHPPHPRIPARHVSGSTKTWVATASERIPLFFAGSGCAVWVKTGDEWEWSGPRGTWWLFDPNHPAMIEIARNHDAMLTTLKTADGQPVDRRLATYQFWLDCRRLIRGWRRLFIPPMAAAIYIATVTWPAVRRVFSWI